ncbi:uncharacterized protein SCHCODRAFT_02573574 [Schizophyllum commune H4-8]|uniref:Expressed protein n=1 Tax=Schizophyllum commune (strain H4-8 / FGSC 9210) TaxID=578458 RepID=D8Q219_SCHCM|nr:uncharacterized protein SCHCODRAFT_02573574 [Schizophyllum commune H4-8]KAI5895676.1 hypothetical protein SCHCODRAFT_02573574 [Schizophyllum commune H4-8]
MLSLPILLLTIARFVLGAQEDVIISLTSPAIVYVPFLCDAGDDCDGGWQRTTTETGAMVIITNGSSQDALDIVPQMFIQFRASALHLATSAFSTADVDMTVSQGKTTISQNVTSRTGLITVIGLNSTALTTLSLTYVPPGRLDLGQLWATVDDEIATVSSSYLPPLTTPPTATLPTYTTATNGGPTIVVSQPPRPHQKLDLAYPLGLTLGLSFGLTLLATGAYLVWRRWKQYKRKKWEEEAQENEAWERRKGKMRDDFVQ